MHVNKGWSRYDIINDIKKLKVPLYYFYGKHDVLYKSKEVIHLLKHNPDRIVEFKQSAHSPMMEEPRAFIQAVKTVYMKYSKE